MLAQRFRAVTASVAAVTVAGAALTTVLISGSSSQAQSASVDGPTLSVFDALPASEVRLSAPRSVAVDASSLRLTQQLDGYEAYAAKGVDARRGDVYCVAVKIPDVAEATGCSPTKVISSRPPVISTPLKVTGASKWLLAVLVPDDTASLRIGNGPSVKVIHNVAFALVDREPTDLTVTSNKR